MIDYRDFWALDDKEASAVIGWLERHPNPIVRHRCAYSWNWDQGHRVLGWIVSQPTCDRATAIHIFGASQPDELIDPKGEFFDSEVNDRSSVYHLLELIVDLLGEGRFSEENFETQWSDEWEGAMKKYSEIVASPDIDEKWRRAVKLKPKRPIFEWNSHPAFPDGIPQELHELGK